MTVWVQPPVVGGADTYTIISNPSASVQATLKSEGYPSFPTLAAAEAFVKARNGSFTLSTNPLKAAAQLATGNDTAAGQSQSTASDLLGTLAEFLGLPAGTKISGRELAVRAAKIVTGITMIIVGLVKLTGADKAVTTAAKAVAK